MKITKVLETNEGKFSFDGELTQDEHDILIDAGFKLLFGLGTLPFVMQQLEDIPKDKLN